MVPALVMLSLNHQTTREVPDVLVFDSESILLTSMVSKIFSDEDVIIQGAKPVFQLHMNYPNYSSPPLLIKYLYSNYFKRFPTLWVTNPGCIHRKSKAGALTSTA